MKQKIPILGILGGGQLGRMSALAAAKFGIRTHIFCPEENAPAFQVTDLRTCADYNDTKALDQFASSVDHISYEFENIPVKTIRYLENRQRVSPGSSVLSVCQDRIEEKSFLNGLGIETCRWAPCKSENDIRQNLETWKTSECIIKTARFGYDGKGQIKQKLNDNLSIPFTKFSDQSLIIEDIVDFSYEASLIFARDVFGNVVFYPLTINDHKHHILNKSRPVSDTPDISDKAKSYAMKIADALKLVGLMAIELFITSDGHVLANELAPRTHNSGHWTMDGCDVSQFDNHVRAVCGLPVLTPRQHSDVTMINLIGDDVNDLDKYYAMDGACVHLYGKDEAKPGRKMGHVNLVSPLKN